MHNLPLAGVVTGGSRGIGAGICDVLLASGMQVVSLDTREPERTPDGRDLITVAGSVTDRSAVAGSIEFCVSEFGRFDYLIANAGVVSAGKFLELTDDQWQSVIDVNLTGTFYCVQEAARAMSTSGAGSIVVISSINAWWAEPRTAHYNTSKAGCIGLVRSAARELAPLGIRVNAVCPGMIQTPLTARITIDSPHADDYLHNIPTGRYGLPADVGRLTRFLVSPDSAFITGDTLTVDGGQTLGTDFTTILQPADQLTAGKPRRPASDPATEWDE